ncbi:hypothetical protein PsorP6_016979 [Peronosclerospora sorghi]|uniref:Uncharacterized protein n=1 Tax=Peronosclerospora sorghi TaxID=230839 RepID=A0ACC0WDP4_9STRA|nr:hypothetical protein PsorP6_016979 [Peronosclerospora sorghi]
MLKNAHANRHSLCLAQLRATNAVLGKYLERIQRALPKSEMPHLTSKLEVVDVNEEKAERTLEGKFEEILNQGTEAAERLEISKARMEKELRRCSENFLINIDIQEECARMLKELDDQAELLDQEISKELKEKEAKAARAKRRHEENSIQKKNKRKHLEDEIAVSKAQLEEITHDIRKQQEVFAMLEKDCEDKGNEESFDDHQNAEKRCRMEEERMQQEIVELQQEIVLLKEVQMATAKKNDKQSLKAQYTEETQEVLEETAHLENLVKTLSPQINSNGARLHSLLRTLAYSPGIGTLMTRLYQQLSSDSPTSSTSDMPSTPRKTVSLKSFLNVRVSDDVSLP